MRRNSLSQLPLRRVFFFQQGWGMRALIIAIMYFEDGYVQPQIAKYLGVSAGTVCHYLHMFPTYQYDPEDYLVARQKIEEMRNPLYVTHW